MLSVLLALKDAATDGMANGVTENVAADESVIFNEADTAAVSVEDADPHSETVTNIDVEPEAVEDGDSDEDTVAAALDESRAL